MASKFGKVLVTFECGKPLLSAAMNLRGAARRAVEENSSVIELDHGVKSEKCCGSMGEEEKKKKGNEEGGAQQAAADAKKAKDKVDEVADKVEKVEEEVEKVEEEVEKSQNKPEESTRNPQPPEQEDAQAAQLKKEKEAQLKKEKEKALEKLKNLQGTDLEFQIKYAEKLKKAENQDEIKKIENHGKKEGELLEVWKWKTDLGFFLPAKICDVGATRESGGGGWVDRGEKFTSVAFAEKETQEEWIEFIQNANLVLGVTVAEEEITRNRGSKFSSYVYCYDEKVDQEMVEQVKNMVKSLGLTIKQVTHILEAEKANFKRENVRNFQIKYMEKIKKEGLTKQNEEQVEKGRKLKDWKATDMFFYLPYYCFAKQEKGEKKGLPGYATDSLDVHTEWPNYIVNGNKVLGATVTAADLLKEYETSPGDRGGYIACYPQRVTSEFALLQDLVGSS